MLIRNVRKAARNGFTLMEVVLTILIMSMLLTSISTILTTVRNTRDTIHNIQENQLAGPAILDLIERDLRGLMTYNQYQQSLLRLTNRVMLGQEGDSLHFVTTTDSLLWNFEGDRQLRTDYNEVGYCLRPNPENDDFLEIFRREGFGVDEDPFSGGDYIFLHDRIKNFDILVYSEDGPDAEPLEEWNTESSRDDDETGLPARLEIALTLELAPRLMREQLMIAPTDRRTVTYKRVIRLPEILRVPQEDVPVPGLPPIPGSTPEATPSSAAPEADPSSAGPDGGDPGGGTGRGNDSDQVKSGGGREG